MILTTEFRITSAYHESYWVKIMLDFLEEDPNSYHSIDYTDFNFQERLETHFARKLVKDVDQNPIRTQRKVPYDVNPNNIVKDMAKLVQDTVLNTLMEKGAKFAGESVNLNLELKISDYTISCDRLFQLPTA